MHSEQYCGIGQKIDMKKDREKEAKEMGSLS